jgi:hypothetical protein
MRACTVGGDWLVGWLIEGLGFCVWFGVVGVIEGERGEGKRDRDGVAGGRGGAGGAEGEQLPVHPTARGGAPLVVGVAGGREGEREEGPRGVLAAPLVQCAAPAARGRTPQDGRAGHLQRRAHPHLREHVG